MRTVLRDGAGALGASIIVHDMVLHLLIVMAVISLFEMTVRLGMITALIMLLQVLVMSAVAVFIVVVLIIVMMVMITSVIIGPSGMPHHISRVCSVLCASSA